MKTQLEKIEKIQKSYLPTNPNKLDELQALDKKVKRPATAFAYTFGAIGSLVLGTGMCLAMKVIGASNPVLMPVGIGVGLVGIAMVSATYFIYRKILKKRKEKYANEILSMANTLLSE